MLTVEQGRNLIHRAMVSADLKTQSKGEANTWTTAAADESRFLSP